MLINDIVLVCMCLFIIPQIHSVKELHYTMANKQAIITPSHCLCQVQPSMDILWKAIAEISPQELVNILRAAMKAVERVCYIIHVPFIDISMMDF